MNDDFADLMESIMAIESRLDNFDERLGQLEETVDDLEARTDMLQVVDDADQMEAEQRSTALLQHMHNKIQSNGIERVFLTRDDAEAALHHPDLDRTTIYTDMERCERLVGDTDVCWYEKAAESRVDEACVHLDLSDDEISTVLNGGA
jgi:hypothetical protein